VSSGGVKQATKTIAFTFFHFIDVIDLIFFYYFSLSALSRAFPLALPQKMSLFASQVATLGPRQFKPITKMSIMKNLLFLYFQWLQREVAGRYRGSWLGLSWPLLQPLLQIVVFTLIFHEFMQVRWPTLTPNVAPSDNGALFYGLNVFAGLAVFNFMAEILGRAPVAVLSQPNLVT
jgi:hypothetical protein